MATVTRAEITFPNPLANVVDETVKEIIQKSLVEVTDSTNRQIEKGVGTDTDARIAEGLVREGRQVVKVVDEIRKSFTRPLDQAKSDIMQAEKQLMHPLIAGNGRLDKMLIDRVEEIHQQELKAQAEYDRKVKAAAEVAAKREETNKKISLGLGGDGNVTPVVPDKIERTLSTAKLLNTTQTKLRVAKEKIEAAIENGVREIPGVNIYTVWTYQIIDVGKVPDEYRHRTR